MKLGKLTLTVAAIALGLCLQPTTSWSSRHYSQVVSGTVTAAPTSDAIEVDHHSYQIKRNSAASKAFLGIFLGEVVDVVMDGPPNSTTEVISIIKHPGS
jgi:hypothetical protein